MIAINKPTLVRDVCESYAHLFAKTSLSFGPLSSLIGFSLFGLASLSEGARVFPLSPSVSVLSDAIKSFDAEPFMKRARKLLLNSYSVEGKANRLVFAVDDTPIPKSGKTNYAVGLWTGSNKITYHGQKLMVLVAIDPVLNIAFPVAFRFCLKQGVPGYVPGHKLVLEMLEVAKASGFPSAPVIADSWFDSVELINECAKRGHNIFFEVKSNRKVRHATSRTIPKKKLSTYFRKGKRSPVSVEIAGKKRKVKYINLKHAYISGRKSPVKIAAVFNHQVGFDLYGYFLTTDMSADENKIWMMSRLRWAIETMFRDLKQNFAMGKLPGRSRADAEISICIPFALLLNIRLSQVEQEALANNRLQTIGTYVEQIKEQVLAQSIVVLTQTWNDRTRKRTAARRSENRVNKKPVNTAAGAIWGGKTYAA